MALRRFVIQLKCTLTAIRRDVPLAVFRLFSKNGRNLCLLLVRFGNAFSERPALRAEEDNVADAAGVGGELLHAIADAGSARHGFRNYREGITNDRKHRKSTASKDTRAKGIKSSYKHLRR